MRKISISLGFANFVFVSYLLAMTGCDLVSKENKSFDLKGATDEIPDWAPGISYKAVASIIAAASKYREDAKVHGPLMILGPTKGQAYPEYYLLFQSISDAQQFLPVLKQSLPSMLLHCRDRLGKIAILSIIDFDLTASEADRNQVPVGLEGAIKGSILLVPKKMGLQFKADSTIETSSSAGVNTSAESIASCASA